MIEIGKNFLWGIASAKQAARTRKQTAHTLAAQAEQSALTAAEQYAKQLEYLFRSSAEKNQLAYERARQQLAAQQARRVAQGQAATSTAEEQQTAAVRQHLQETRTQQNLQTEAAQATNTFQQKWQEFLSRLAGYRKQAKRKNRLGSVGQAFKDLFQ